MRVPVWRVTRTAPARRAFEALEAAGVTVSRLERFERVADEPMSETEPPADVSFRVDTSPVAERTDRPELADTDRVVVAVATEDVVGVQPIVRGGSVHVAPLDRRIGFDGAYLWGLGVDPGWRRRGIATALVARALEEIARETGNERVYALIGADNGPSKGVLRRVGFERTGVRSYYRLFGFERRASRVNAGASRR